MIYRRSLFSPRRFRDPQAWDQFNLFQMSSFFRRGTTLTEMCVYVCMYIYIYVYIYICRYIYIYNCIYFYICTYTDYAYTFETSLEGTLVILWIVAFWFQRCPNMKEGGSTHSRWAKKPSKAVRAESSLFPHPELQPTVTWRHLGYKFFHSLPMGTMTCRELQNLRKLFLPWSTLQTQIRGSKIQAKKTHHHHHHQHLKTQEATPKKPVMVNPRDIPSYDLSLLTTIYAVYRKVSPRRDRVVIYHYFSGFCYFPIYLGVAS